MKNTGNSPIVSIIMPTYNRAKLITASIESILNQTFSNWELIIIDDGSEDDTEEIIYRIHDPRISFYEAGRIGKGGKIKNMKTFSLIVSGQKWQLFHKLFYSGNNAFLLPDYLMKKNLFPMQIIFSIWHIISKQ